MEEKRVEEATWESKKDMKARYPFLYLSSDKVVWGTNPILPLNPFELLL